MSDLHMDSQTVLPSEDVESDGAGLSEQVATFVRTNPGYYMEQFERIGNDARFVLTFNVWAGLFGPVWYSARGLWNWGLTFLIIETFAFVQIVRGLFGDLASSAWDRIAQIEGTLDLRRQQLAAALENGSDKVDVYHRTVESLEGAIGGIRLEARQLEESGVTIALAGFALLVVVKVGQAVYANTVLERRFSNWISNSNQYRFRNVGEIHGFECRIREHDRCCDRHPLQFPGGLSPAYRLSNRAKHTADVNRLGRRFFCICSLKW